MRARLRILVAHQSADAIARLRRFAEEDGHELFVSRDGKQALSLAIECEPHVAFIAVDLPTVSGLQVCYALSTLGHEYKDVDTAVLLPARDASARRVAQDLGARWCFDEPLTQDDFRQALDERQGARSSENTPQESLFAFLAPETGLMNGAYLRVRMLDECKRARRYGQDVSLLVVRLENLPDIAQEHGKETAREIVNSFSSLLLHEVRDVDVASWRKPAQFYVLMPCTSGEGARVVAQRLAQSIREQGLAPAEVRLRASFGLACTDGREPSPVSDLDELVKPIQPDTEV